MQDTIIGAPRLLISPASLSSSGILKTPLAAFVAQSSGAKWVGFKPLIVVSYAVDSLVMMVLVFILHMYD